MSKTVADFEDFIFPFAPDAPTSVIQHAVRESIVKFMQQTKMVTDYAQFPLVAKVPDYVIDVPDCRLVLEVRKVMFGCSGSVPDGTWTELDAHEYKADLDHDGMPSIVLNEAPVESCHKPLDLDMCVEYAWAISRDGCDVPDFVYERHMQEIQDGALALLYAMPGQEWTNLQYAMTLREKVEDQYKVLRSKFSKWGQSPSKMRRLSVRPRSAFAGFWRA